MDLENIVREVTVRGKAEGVDDVARGYNQVADGADRATVTVERQSKASESAERALAKLRRQIDDSFRAQEQFERGEQALARAQEQGLITAQEKGRQMDLLNAKYKASSEGVSQLSEASGDFADKFSSVAGWLSKVTGHATGLRDTVQDTTAKVTEGGRAIAAGFAGVLEKGFTSLLSPVNLVAAGLAAVAVVAVTAYATMRDNGRSVEQTLENQVKLIQQVKDGYDSAAEASKRLSEADRNVALVKATQQVRELDRAVEKAAQSLQDALTSQPGRIFDVDLIATGMDEQLRNQLVVAERFKAFDGPIMKFVDGLRSGRPDVDAFRTSVAALAQANPALTKLADELLSASDKLRDLFKNRDDGQALIDVLNGVADAATRARLGLSAEPDAQQEYTKAIKALEDYNETANKTALIRRDQQAAALQYAKALNAANQQENSVDANNLRAIAAEKYRLALEGITEKHKDEEKAYERQEKAINKNIATMGADAKALGLSAGQHARLRAEAQLTAAVLADKNNVEDYADKIAKVGKAVEKSADDFERLKFAARLDFADKTMLLSDRDKQIAQELSGIYGNNVTAALASSEAAARRLQLTQEDMFRTAKSGAEQFTTSLVSGLMSGKSLIESLHTSLNNLASSMANNAIQSAFSGNFAVAGVQAVIAIGAKLLGNLFDDSQEKELQKAKDAWAAMADKMRDFTEAARGVEIATVVRALREIKDQADELWVAAKKAGDEAGAAQVALAYVQQVNNRFNEFAFPTIGASAEAQKIIDVRRDAAQLTAELERLGRASADTAAALDAGVTAQIDALRRKVASDLTADINETTGRGFVNQIDALLAKRAQLLNERDLTKVDTSLLDRWFAAQAQAVVDSADLVGSAFQEFLGIFPDLTGIVHESTEALKRQAEEQERLAEEQKQFYDGLEKDINDFIRGLKFGDLSTLSPSQQFAAAQADFLAQAARARVDPEAASSLTKFADTYLQQARSYLGPSQAFGAISAEVVSVLQQALDAARPGGLGGAGGIAPTTATASSARPDDYGTTQSDGTRAAPAGDSGATAEIRALRDQVRLLGEQVARMSDALYEVGDVGNTLAQETVDELKGMRADARQAVERARIRNRTATG